MMGVSVSVRVCVHVSCQAVWNIFEKWRGLVYQSPAHDKSLYLKPIHHSGKWTIGNVMENRVGSNERRRAGCER